MYCIFNDVKVVEKKKGKKKDGNEWFWIKFTRDGEGLLNSFVDNTVYDFLDVGDIKDFKVDINYNFKSKELDLVVKEVY